MPSAASQGVTRPATWRAAGALIVIAGLLMAWQPAWLPWPHAGGHPAVHHH